MVKWGEFRIGDLFKLKISKSIDRGSLKLSETDKEYQFIGRTAVNNGVQGYVDYLGFKPNDANTFSIIQIGENIAQFRNKQWYSSQNIFLLTPKYEMLIKTKNFIISSINLSLKIYKGGYSSYPTLQKLKDIKIQLPITSDGKIDFTFMEEFIAELEAQHISKLEAYLSAAGLKNIELSSKEEKALKDFEGIYWNEYKIDSLFEKIKTKKLPYKAEELTKKPIGKYTLPCLTSSFMNQGLNYFAPIEGATILKNVISIPSNSDVYRAYYQSNNFTVLSDAYAIRWSNNDVTPSSTLYLFLVMCVNKVTDLPIYSYKNKLGGWNIVKDKYIKLPTKNNQPDYEYMETLISAVQKLVIKEVVQYTDRKINATNQVISQTNLLM